MDVTLVWSPVKRISNMAVGIDEKSDVLVGSFGPKISKKFDLRSWSETKMSVAGNATDVGFSENDALTKQYASLRQVGPTTFPFESVNVDRCHPVIS